MSLSVDWNSVFVPAIGLAEIVVRGSLMYLGLFVIMRFMARRQAGHFGPADLRHRPDRRCRPEWARKRVWLGHRGSRARTYDRWMGVSLDWLAWRFPATRPYLKPASLTLIRDGRLIPQNLRREMITEDELKSQLREQSVESYEDIKLATLEGDGRPQRPETKLGARHVAGGSPQLPSAY